MTEVDTRPPPGGLVSRSLAGTQSSHRWAELPGGFDRLNCRAIYPSSNEWGIPDLPGGEWTPARLVAYSDRRAIAAERPARLTSAAVHFFLDDYRFETVWAKPERGLCRIASLGASLTPDFSMWRDMPLVMQLWQVYRSRWCGAWLTEHGIRVIPTLSWSTSDTWPFAFAGVARGSVVAVSTVGITDGTARALFREGYAEMCRQLEPSTVMVYGRVGEMVDVELAPVKGYASRWEV